MSLCHCANLTIDLSCYAGQWPGSNPDHHRCSVLSRTLYPHSCGVHKAGQLEAWFQIPPRAAWQPLSRPTRPPLCSLAWQSVPQHTSVVSQSSSVPACPESRPYVRTRGKSKTSVMGSCLFCLAVCIKCFIMSRDAFRHFHTEVPGNGPGLQAQKLFWPGIF